MRGTLKFKKKPNSFDLDNPDQLQEKVFFDIMLQFARRGREELRELKTNSFEIRTDDQKINI